MDGERVYSTAGPIVGGEHTAQRCSGIIPRASANVSVQLPDTQDAIADEIDENGEPDELPAEAAEYHHQPSAPDARELESTLEEHTDGDREWEETGQHERVPQCDRQVGPIHVALAQMGELVQHDG